jgi:WD40 repeat protein
MLPYLFDKIRLWNPRSGELLRTLTGHSGEVKSVAISPDGQTLVSGSADKTIKIWRLDTGELLQTLTDHSGAVNSVALSPDGQLLASGSSDKTVKIWQVV